MHLETLQHLRSLATQHDDLVPVAKSLLLNLLDTYERHADLERRLLHGLADSERELAELREAGTPACSTPDALAIVILQQLLKADDYDTIEAVKASAEDYLKSLNACPLNFAHQPHDHCDGSAASQRPEPLPVNTVNPVNPVPAPEVFEAHGHTWTRHTPGNPCPVPAYTKVIVLLRRELNQLPGCSEVRKAGEYAWCPIMDGRHSAEIIGWRHATPEARLDAPRPEPSASDTPREPSNSHAQHKPAPAAK